jgi:molecular chaperone DnaK
MDTSLMHNEIPSRLGVDFGNDTLVITPGGGEDIRCSALVFPGWSEQIHCGEPDDSSSCIPVCIHYAETGEQVLGASAARGDRAAHPCTARWMRKYVLENSPVRMPGGGSRGMRYQDAGEMFLREILTRAIRQTGRSAGIIFTIPADAPEHYIQWLGRIAGAAGAPSWETIDESRAVVAGYGLAPSPGDGFLILRCDELELGALVVVAGDPSTGGASSAMVVLGSAAEPAGCGAIDTWIARELMVRNRREWNRAGNRCGSIPPSLLQAARDARWRLIRPGKVPPDHPDAGCTGGPAPEFSPEDLTRVLASNGFFTSLERTIDRALALARSRGADEQSLRAVILAGSGCALPAVQDAVRKRFAGLPVHCDRPFDAAARGAAHSSPSVTDPGRIRRDYALRYWDPAAREHRYRFLVHGGARFPSAGQVARVTICAAYDGQTQLGIPLYEMPAPHEEGISALELVANETGGVRLAGPGPDSAAQGRPVPVTGGVPIYLAASPPAVKGEPRFELTFTIDAGRHLCVTVRDLATNRLLKKNEALHTLV